MKTRTKLLLISILIILPFASRVLWFHRGWYRPPEIPEIEDIQRTLPLPEYRPLMDQPIETTGVVVIDLSHDNNLRIDDLAPLRDRLTARGLSITTLNDSNDSLEDCLRGAIALIIPSPTENYTVEELGVIANFMDDGGRMLLAADPTRPASTDYYYDLDSLFFRISAVPAINSIANHFGIVYFNDYLYNMVRNEGNYRNVIFPIQNNEQPLTQDLNSVVFFATHSLHMNGIPILSGDRNTLSPVRSGETDLMAAALTSNERILALGDLTFLTAPYHTIADNDRFLSNIADWLATAPREWALEDFPFLFSGPVDLVQLGEGTLDPRLITHGDALQEIFHEAHLSLNLRGTADTDQDTLFVGTFDNASLVQEYLETAGVTITSSVDDEPFGDSVDVLEIDGLGTLNIQGTTLYMVHHSTNRTVVIALAEDGEAAILALDRLASVDFSDCFHSDNMTICSTGEVQEGSGLEAEADEPSESIGETITAEAPPRIATPSEAEAAFESMTLSLDELASETYDVYSQAGETYKYTIELDTSQDVLWTYGWCTETLEQLNQNWENISLAFSADGEAVPLDNFVMLDVSLIGMECQMYYALLTDWPPGMHLIVTEVTFETAINDGFEDYPAGTHVFEYWVYVGEGSD